MQAITDSDKSVYRCLRGTPTVYTPHKGPEMVKSAPLCGSVSTASPLSSFVSPSRHLAILSGLSHHHSIVVTEPPCSLTSTRAPHPLLLWARAPPPPLLCPPPSPFLCARAPRLPFSMPPSFRPSACHASRAVLTFVFFLHAFHVLPRSPPRLLPECSLISCTFIEASAGLRCRPPPACGGAPGAVLVCFADHCFILRTMQYR